MAALAPCARAAAALELDDGAACRAGSRARLGRFPAEKLFERKQALRVDELQQAQFEMKALLLLVAKIGVGAQHDLQEAREVFFAEALGNA